MCRKFLVALVGLIVAIVGIVYGNNVAIVSGTFLGACFIIGEAIVDKAATVKKSQNITVSDVKDATKGE